MKRILVALDGAASAQETLRTAAELARSTSAELVLFRSGDVSGSVELTGNSVDGQRFAQRIREEILRELEGVLRAVPPGVATRMRVELGPAPEAILRAARAEEADVIVVGSHGMGQQRGSLGAVAAELLEKADRSVLVVRPRVH